MTPGRSSRRCPCLLLLAALCILCLLGGCATTYVAVPKTTIPQAEPEEPNQDLIELARSNIGIPYKYGGTSPTTGFDCSGLVCWTFGQVGISVPRTASAQYQYGMPIPKEELQPGDIVIFKGMRGRSSWHSGIYTGDGMFLHSPRTGKTVTETSLDSRYYSKYYIGGFRIPRDGSAEDLYAAYKKEQSKLATHVKNARKADGKSSPRLTAKKSKNSKNTVASAQKKRTSGQKSSKTSSRKKGSVKQDVKNSAAGAPKKKASPQKQARAASGA